MGGSRIWLFELNVDVSVLQGSSSFVIGMILRDYTGCFLWGRVMRFDKEMFVFDAETVGINKVLSWILTRLRVWYALNLICSDKMCLIHGDWSWDLNLVLANRSTPTYIVIAVDVLCFIWVIKCAFLELSGSWDAVSGVQKSCENA